MEDKILDLMAKMYEELSSKMDSLGSRMDSMEKKLDSKADKADLLKLEHKIDENSKALFDGYKQVYEKLTIIDEKVEDLKLKVAKQDVEIRVIKNAGI